MVNMGLRPQLERRRVVLEVSARGEKLLKSFGLIRSHPDSHRGRGVDRGRRPVCLARARRFLGDIFLP